MNLTESFIEYLYDKQKNINEQILSMAKGCVLDYIGVVSAGALKNKKKWSAYLDHIPEGNAVLFGYDKQTDGKTAALINGFNAHSLELDDGHRFAMIHLGASIISAIEAVKAEFDVSEEHFLTGIVMGYEAACRTAITMQPSHKQKGYHTSGTCGTIGAAIGAAFAIGIDRIQMKKVLTSAAGSAAGLLEMQEQRSEVKPYNLGRAAMDGLVAAYMGLSCFDVPDDILGGERGFFRSFADKWEAKKLIEEHDYFEIERIYTKPYVSCRHSHSAVEAAIMLSAEISSEDIDKVEVRTYKLGVKGHDHKTLKGLASAKLSTPYAVAAALMYGRADLSLFEPIDEDAARLAKRVDVVEDEDLTKESTNKRIAIVSVRLKDGSIKTKRVDHAKGEPENPMTEKELMEKNNMLLTYKGDLR